MDFKSRGVFPGFFDNLKPPPSRKLWGALKSFTAIMTKNKPQSTAITAYFLIKNACFSRENLV